MAWLVELQPDAVFDHWRPYARFLLSEGVRPDEVCWQTATGDLLSSHYPVLYLEHIEACAEKQLPSLKVPRAFLSLARYACSHNCEQRFSILYQLLWRLKYESRGLLCNETDADVRQVVQWAKSVGRETHKMKAFVRFRCLLLDNRSPVYLAWFEPEHYSLPLVTDFFCKRFYSMEWSILTPHLSAHWSRQTLRFSAGCSRDQMPEGDGLEEYWRTYYANIFNPARLKVEAMCSEMPRKYWHNLPESTLISPLIAKAEHVTQTMINRPPSSPRLAPRTRFDRDNWLDNKAESN